MTKIEQARQGLITEDFKKVSEREHIQIETLMKDIAEGRTVILKNLKRTIEPVAVGSGLRTKINANIGTSKDRVSLDEEMEKLEIAVRYGADAVMDLSTGGPIQELRRLMLSKSPLPVGTVPIYEAAVKAAEEYGSIVKMSPDDMFRVIEAQAEEGVDFMTVHSGLTLQ
ncbi:MAG: phosphomethylpyrimidine synthase, partial [Nitrospirae bacterium]